MTVLPVLADNDNSRASQLDKDVFTALNKLRTDPNYFVTLLEAEKQWYVGNLKKKHGAMTSDINTNEGVTAV